MAGIFGIELPVALADFKVLGRQGNHPVFNAAGHQVGSYDTLDALCRGQWFVFSGQVAPKFADLYVWSDPVFRHHVPLASKCVAAAKATAKGAAPFLQQVTPGAAKAAVTISNTQNAGSPDPIDLWSLFAYVDPAQAKAAADRAAAGLPPEPPKGAPNVPPYVIWGGLALLTIGGLSLLSLRR